MIKNEKIVIGMSGGVDSSVAAFLLKEQGYEVIGVTIKLWENSGLESKEKVCCSLEDVYDAKRICDKLDIPHYTVNFKNDFQKEVIDYFITEYRLGNTPSPCIMCNEKIKFGKLLEFAKSIGADYIASGHYSKVKYLEKQNKYVLEKGVDEKKDQTYMLYRLSSEQLKYCKFPLENYKKDEIREIAKNNNLITYNKKDSQGICFAPEGYYKFLENNLKNEISKGNIKDENGEILGEHNGYQLYTIGQRRNLGLNLGKPYFIIDILPDKNEIIVGKFEKLFKKEVEVINYKFIYLSENEIDGKAVIARPRFSSKGHIAKLKKEGGRLFLIYESENAENSRGQHIVFYDKNLVIGGGIIF
ncbi:tRNA 2-thiouridine(34) synthase MnmA [Haliovirga abyssi]|uniref:tRNA-specific 2-thiouridylase MnmA n=1 Tax=Haliovirga abyssi TaxID=2996794 RepID=A0AAU9DH94_9FUSO|nr:tRNA 2-thiouridine(34) synthase MnmA [Haliovirga abyssi]BDU50099.1 tRNA-specific 2-thiouridylase MnmA 2 [Haliovirga abyssi]